MKKQYISSLKGIACLLVALGHFLGAIKYASSIPMNTNWLSFLKNYRLDFFINESFWLYLFFVVSGYLVAHSIVTRFSEIIIRSITRFLRLALPIFCACLIIFLFSKCIPFYNDDTILFFDNMWLQSAYSQDFTFLNMLLSPILVLLLKNTIYNSPYWVLRDMFFSSILIYCITYIGSKIQSKKFRLVLSLLLTVTSLCLNKIVFSCIVGANLCYYENNLRSMLKSKVLLSLSGVISFGFCFVSAVFGAILFFSWLIIAIPCFTTLQKALEIKPLGFLGDISFGIYSFHWPIFCSVGSLVIIKLWNIVGGGLALLTSTLLSLILSILLAIAFFHLMEKPSARLVSWIRNRLQILFSSKKE